MKIKEVAVQTGLTEKTIRYYEEKSLVEPSKKIIKDREFRSYSLSDVKRLKLIATLRKLDFSIAQIRNMFDEPGSVKEILKDYSMRADNELSFKKSISERLKHIDYSKISKIEDFAVQFEDASKNRPLPAADIELEFYKIDGLTKEELDSEIVQYEERVSAKLKNKIRNTTILFSFVILLYSFLAFQIWKNTYSLIYIQSYDPVMNWRILIIPFFIILTFCMIFLYVKSRKYLFNNTSLHRIGRYILLILLFVFTINIFFQFQISKKMDDLRIESKTKVFQEWYPIYRMANYIDNYLLSQEIFENNNGFSLYVNQTCYNFPSIDSLQSDIYEFLTSCYDVVFRETIRRESISDPQKAIELLKEMNEELLELSRSVIDIDDIEKIVIRTSPSAAQLRQKAEAMMDKYIYKTESLFK